MAAGRGATALGWLIVCVLGGAVAEDYVVYQERTTTNTPAARTLAAAVLHHATNAASAVGRFIWLFGGMDASLASRNDLWRLELSTNAWTAASPGGDTPSSRQGHSMILHRSKAYMFGGEAAGNTKLQDLYMLHLDGTPNAEPIWEDITSNTTNTPPPRRTKHTASLVRLKNVAGDPWGMIIFGGLDRFGNALNDMYQLNLDTLEWDALVVSGATLPQQRMRHAACTIDDDFVVIFGGAHTSTAEPTLFNDVRLYDVYRGTWREAVPVSSLRPVERDGHVMATISDNVYIFGGVNRDREKLNDLWSFNTYSALAGRLQWNEPTAMSSTPAARYGHVSMTSLGAMLFLGGMDTSDAVLDDVHEMSTGCTGSVELRESRGIFSDGNGLYENSADCRWVLNPSTAQANVRLVITDLELLDDGDRLMVYDGSTT
jgi:N-acetylneuraminic acid mutarotase